MGGALIYGKRRLKVKVKRGDWKHYMATGNAKVSSHHDLTVRSNYTDVTSCSSLIGYFCLLQIFCPLQLFCHDLKHVLTPRKGKPNESYKYHFLGMLLTK